MAAPNIKSLTTINGKTVGAALGTSSADILTNAAASGKVLKVNVIHATNVHASDNVDATVTFFDASASASYKLAGPITVPNKAALAVLEKSIYLEEGDKITALASAVSSVEIVISYEDLS